LIKIINSINSEPYVRFYSLYNNALDANQKNIEAIAISSFNSISGEVDSRYVNLKYIDNDNWIFFSNYNSPKALQFSDHNKISCLIFWPKINIQIRIKATIYVLDTTSSDNHFYLRSNEKNALAISSDQSKIINSYDKVIQNYNEALNKINKKTVRPSYWGGFLFKPYSFEFWEGHKSRLNKRDVYKIKENNWEHMIIQP
tara:strand:- start:1620 stop:2219 length:600 start_codon:yes stop_codon:yes gene_type:complete